jgi:signal transduction histidine kinase
MSALYPPVRRTAQIVVSVGFVIAVYEGLVAGELHFWPAAPDSWILPMWVLAATLSGLGLGPLNRLVTRLLRQAWPSAANDPYAALASAVAGAQLAVPAEDALDRLTEIAKRGTGARSARVAMVEETIPLSAGRSEMFPIIVDGKVLAHLVLEPSRRALSKADQRLALTLADAAGAVLRNAALTTELAEQLRRREAQAVELDRSRRRVVAVRDEARERLGKEIQDSVGSALADMKTRAASLEESEDWQPQLASLTELVDKAVKDFRRIVHGVYPATLTDHGLRAALGNLVADLPGNSKFTAPDLPRFEALYEAGVYFCVAALLEPIAEDVEVSVEFEDGGLSVRLSGAEVDWDPGTLEAIRDRVAALDGSLRLGGTDLAELVVPMRTEVAA